LVVVFAVGVGGDAAALVGGDLVLVDDPIEGGAVAEAKSDILPLSALNPQRVRIKNSWSCVARFVALTMNAEGMTMSSMRRSTEDRVGAAAVAQRESKGRYKIVTEEKAGGATYTPKHLADFVAKKILETAEPQKGAEIVRVLDPAVGDGELLVSLLSQLEKYNTTNVEVHGFETDERALKAATSRLKKLFPKVTVYLNLGNFLEFVLERSVPAGGLFAKADVEQFDLIIANPPYVRTQIMGASQAQLLAKQFGLAGRVDLYHAFVLGMAEVLKPEGTAGVIVSNRFMTTRSGASMRRALREVSDIHHVWDLGDTKLFDAAVLPAVLIVRGKGRKRTRIPRFSSIYETTQTASGRAADPITAVLQEGIIEVEDGRRFQVRHGDLDSGGSLDSIWRIATEAGDSWLATVEANTWGAFRRIGKIRVGVKTCADQVFIRDDWDELPGNMQPELLRPLVTHHIGRCFKATTTAKPRQILYPHQKVNGCRVAADLAQNPRAKAYLENHRKELEGRRYVIDGGRKWYEIWVPQDPAGWDAPKLVFRDISEKPTFWIDLEGSVVNGDCYWLTADHKQDERLLWLAVAVGNSTFIEEFYDHRFHNKLYSGRRRFMTQYVEQFPLPDPDGKAGGAIIERAEALYKAVEGPTVEQMKSELNRLVWEAFGLGVEEIAR
jgi:tRNA1(Val) A37 N6-methylase TrmN6